MMENICDNCRYWRRNVTRGTPHGWGICNYWDIDAGYILRTGGDHSLVTGPTFGCVRFTSKPKGPFRIQLNPDGVPFLRHEKVGILSPALTDEAAPRLRDWLNKLWSDK